MGHRQLLHRRAHHLADLQRPLGVGVRQQQAELLAAIAAGKAHGVGGDAGQRFAEPGEAGVAFGMAIGVVEELEVIDVDHQQRQFAAILLRLHPFEIEPALEAAPVGEAGQHVDRGHHGEPVIGGDQFALALAELRRHRVEGAGQRNEFGRQAAARRARRPVALAKSFGHRRHHLDRLDDQLLRGDQRAEQHKQADEAELQIGGANLAVDRGGHLGFIDADDQARLRAGNAGKVDRALRAVGGGERKRARPLVGTERLVGDRRQQRHIVERTADHAGLIGRRRQHGAGAVDQSRRNAGPAAEIAHDLRHPVEIDAGDDDGICLRH